MPPSREQQNLNDKITEYNHDVHEANSVKTGVLTFLTAGIYGGYTLYELHEKLSDVHSMKDRVDADRQAFNAACDAMDQANSAVKLTSQALNSLNTGVEQAVNQLQDICTMSSPDLHLMRTFIKVFVQEYSAAAQRLGSGFQPDDAGSDLDSLLTQGQNLFGSLLGGLTK